MKEFPFFAFLLAVAAMLSGTSSAAKSSIVKFDPPGSTYTTVHGINGHGAIVGDFTDANGNHGFIRAQDGTFTIFDNPFGVVPYELESTSINVSGTVVGAAVDHQGVSHGFIRQPNGVFTVFDASPGAHTEATAISNTGIIVGFFYFMMGGQNSPLHGFSRAVDGSITVIDNPGGAGTSTAVAAINDNGSIVGYSGNKKLRAFRRDPTGEVKQFGVPGYGTSIAESISNSSTIAGDAGVKTSSACFLRHKGKETVITPPEGYSGIYLCSANEVGEMEGLVFSDPNNVIQHGWFRSASGVVTTFDVPGAVATGPSAINREGVVTGVYTDVAGQLHGFLRRP